MKKIIATAAAAALALALAGCGSPAASSSASSASASSASASASASSASASSQSVSKASFTDAKTADDAAKGAGIEKFGVMDKVTLDGKDFKDPKFGYAQGVAQATYENGAIALIVRKAEGSHTAPLTDRDKTEFAQTWSKSYEGLDVTCYGAAKGAATVISWADGTQEYGVTYQGLGGEDVTLDSDEVASVVKAIKEANATQKKETTEEKSSQSAAAATQNVVPNVIGMDASAAGAAIRAAGLSPDGATEGTVVDQNPAPGTQLDPGDTVSISTEGSTASNAVAVPDVVGMDPIDAANAIENAGLSPDGMASTQGTVTSQAPAAGTMLDPGDTVSFKVDVADNSANDESVTVPSLIGMDAASAGATLENLGLSPDGSSEGTVVEQNPAAGTEVSPGDTVSIKTDAN